MRTASIFFLHSQGCWFTEVGFEDAAQMFCFARVNEEVRTLRRVRARKSTRPDVIPKSKKIEHANVRKRSRVAPLTRQMARQQVDYSSICFDRPPNVFERRDHRPLPDASSFNFIMFR